MKCYHCGRDLKEDAKYCDMCGKDPRRNAFVALCDIASKGYNWCWEIHCGTCGHGKFRVAFSKLAHGFHPDEEIYRNKDFVSREDMSKYKEFYDYNQPSEQLMTKLSEIVSDAKIEDIIEVGKFPDWLGYIGLVLYHCEGSIESIKKISDSFIPQFIELLREDDARRDYLRRKLENNEILSIEDLERIEHSSIVENRINEDLDQ